MAIDETKQKILEIVGKMSQKQLAKIEGFGTKLSYTSILNYTPEEAAVVLNMLNFNMKISGSLSERQRELDERKENSALLAGQARMIRDKAYADIPIDKLDKDYKAKKLFADQKSDEYIDAMKRWAHDTKVANDNAIFDIMG